MIDDTPIKTGIASRGEVLDSAAHSSLLAVDPVKYVNKMSNGQMLPSSAISDLSIEVSAIAEKRAC